MLIWIIIPTMGYASWWHSDWHYRVPITINSAVANQTGKINIDFTALGLSGNLDENSIRVVKEDGTLLAKQEFTDILYNDATDALNNGRGEIKFIIEESGTVTYYIYVDIVENGTKSALSDSYLINGNFEHSSGTTPTGWTIGQSNIGSRQPNNEVHNQSSEGTSVLVTDTGGTGQTRTVTNTARTGNLFHLHGYRDNQESNNQQEQVWIEKTFTVPSSSSGTFDYWFRIQGWDQIINGNNYDRFQVYVNGSLINTSALSINNTAVASYVTSYGKKSSYTTYGDLGWTRASLNLSAYAGSTITIRIEQICGFDNGWKVWQQIDDIEWSLNASITVDTVEEPSTAELTMTKTSCVLEDPINGNENPKRIPGATIRYAFEVRNSGGEDADDVIATDNLGTEFDHNTIAYLQIQEAACNCLGVDPASQNGANGTGDGINPIKLDFGTIASESGVKCGYFEVKVK